MDHLFISGKFYTSRVDPRHLLREKGKRIADGEIFRHTSPESAINRILAATTGRGLVSLNPVRQTSRLISVRAAPGGHSRIRAHFDSGPTRWSSLESRRSGSRRNIELKRSETA